MESPVDHRWRLMRTIGAMRREKEEENRRRDSTPKGLQIVGGDCHFMASLPYDLLTPNGMAPKQRKASSSALTRSGILKHRGPDPLSEKRGSGANLFAVPMTSAVFALPAMKRLDGARKSALGAQIHRWFETDRLVHKISRPRPRTSRSSNRGLTHRRPPTPQHTRC